MRLVFPPPLQGDVGHPGEAGDPGPKGEKVHLLLSFPFVETGEVKALSVNL